MHIHTHANIHILASSSCISHFLVYGLKFHVIFIWDYIFLDTITFEGFNIYDKRKCVQSYRTRVRGSILWMAINQQHQMGTNILGQK